MGNEALSEASVMKGNCYMENGDGHVQVDVFSQNNFLYISTTYPLRTTPTKLNLQEQLVSCSKH